MNNVVREFNEGLTKFGSPILICQTGSKAYGLDTPLSDDDYKGIFIPNLEYLIGLKTVDQVRINEDCWVAHSIEHYVHKMIGQNPTLLEILFIEDSLLETDTWKNILKPAFRQLVYRGAFKPYSAYVLSQLNKARFRHPSMKRYELIQEHGYDTKYMSHVARLAVQCMYLMREHYIPVRVPEPYRSDVMKIKLGQMNKAEALVYCEEMDRKMKEAYDNSTLPTSIDINQFERETYIPLIKRIINER